MCELFGLSVAEPDRAVHALPRFAEKGGWCRDGWGIGWYQGREPFVKKDLGQAKSEKLFHDTVKEARSPVLVAHVRAASGGPIDQCHAHPFELTLRGTAWLFAHNGTIQSLIGPSARHESRVRGAQSDSARLFTFLMDELNGYLGSDSALRGLYPGVKRATAKARKFGGSVNYLLTNGELLFCFSDGARPLWFLRRDKPYGSAFLVTTIPRLTPERWRQLPPNRVIAVARGDIIAVSDPVTAGVSRLVPNRQ